MTDQEKRNHIIREFERFVQEYERDVGFTSYDSEVLEGVLALLKEMIYVSVIYDGNMTVCGNCGAALGKLYYKCPECGRRLNWDD